MEINTTESKSSYWKFAAGFLGIILVAVSAYFIWSKFFKYDINEVYKKAEAEYVAAMTADTYGGKTPEETLDLFVKALHAGDVELASKYFLLDENTSREEWLDYLKAVKEKGLLTKMADDISREAKPLKVSNEKEFSFGLFDERGAVAIYIDLRLNKYSGLWKIENF